MRRHLLGITALLFIAASCGLLFLGEGVALDHPMAGPMIRIGLVLGALWLALPQLQQLLLRFPPWFLATLAGLTLLLCLRPNMARYLLPLAAAIALLQFAGWILKPPTQGKPSHRKRTNPRRNRV